MSNGSSWILHADTKKDDDPNNNEEKEEDSLGNKHKKARYTTTPRMSSEGVPQQMECSSSTVSPKDGNTMTTATFDTDRMNDNPEKETPTTLNKNPKGAAAFSSCTSSSGSCSRRRRRRRWYAQDPNNHIRMEKSTIQSLLFDTCCSSYTFRFEHRVGGILSKYINEERILLLRSDKPGIIGKIIYSTNTALPNSTIDHPNNNNRIIVANAKVHVLEIKKEYRGYDFGSLLFLQAMECLKYKYKGLAKDDSDIKNTTTVGIVCDLNAEEDTRRHNKLIHFYQQLGCSIKRNLLDNHQKSHSVFINNNDGEIYEKIPMQIFLPLSLPTTTATTTGAKPQHPIFHSLVDCSLPPPTTTTNNNAPSVKSFLPVQLYYETLSNKIIPLEYHYVVIINDRNENIIEIKTTKGQPVVVDVHDGNCSLGASTTIANHQTNQFLLYKVLENEQGNDNNTKIDPHASFFKTTAEQDNQQNNNNNNYYDHADLWIVRPYFDSDSNDNPASSSYYNNNHPQFSSSLFLTYDLQENCFKCTTIPTFWKKEQQQQQECHDCNPNENSFRVVVTTTDTPMKRQHYKKIFDTQTISYVKEMYNKYSNSNSFLHKMTLQHALIHLIKDEVGFPLMYSNTSNLSRQEETNENQDCMDRTTATVNTGISLRTRCFQTAEAARANGHPDWVQLIALIYPLGGVLNRIEAEKTNTDSENDECDWTIPIHSKIVGCGTERSFSLPSMEHKEGCFHRKDNKNNGSKLSTAALSSPSSSLGIYTMHCGLQNVYLSWTGTEYMYHMLKYNSTNLPEDGLFMLRYVSLYGWHHNTTTIYNLLASEEDNERKPFVADFYDLLIRSEESILQNNVEMTDEECEYLFHTYYSNIVSKYCADGILSW